MPPLRTTLGSLMVEESLPEPMRNYGRVMDAKAMKAVLQEIAEKSPGDYKHVSKKLSDVGREVSQSTGGYSFGLKHLRESPLFSVAKRQMQAGIEQILDSDLDDDSKHEKIVLLAGEEQKLLEDAIYKEALEQKNPLAMQVASGARGKPLNLKSLIGADLLYQDHRGNLIPFPVTNGYGKGLTPAEYFGSTFGARKSLFDVKRGTQEAGFFGKQLVQASHRLLVTKHDAEGDPIHEMRGLPVDTEDADSEGSLLSFPVGGYPRDTPITPRILKDLRDKKIGRIVVRSPLTGGPPDGGLYAKDVGIRERGGIAPVGDQIGVAAAQAIAEPVSQGSLASKHSGGVAGSARVASGFNLLNQLIQTPKTFKGGAAHAEVDGSVHSVKDAPAGGKHVTIDGVQHFVAPGFQLKVKPGDIVEAGDVLSEGIPNPAKVVEHKGVGEGRRYFMHTFREALKDSGIAAHRRNIEVLSRGLINHVRLNEEMGPHVPGDVVSYDQMEHSWEPRDGSQKIKPKASVGKYLEKPVLHYSIGTKIKPSMLKDFEDFGIKDLEVHDDPPPFEPEMIRGMENLSHDPDWMVRMLGSNIEKNLLAGARRGDTSDPSGTSFVPALVEPHSFGTRGKVKGFKTEPAPQPNFKPSSVLDI